MSDAFSKVLKFSAEVSVCKKPLDVGNNGIGYEAGKFIADYIATDNDLTHLNLYMNELCDLGAIDIAKALKAGAYTRPLFSST